MYKLPRGHKKKTGAWKRRYFVLTVDELHYYTKEQTQFEDDFKADLAVNSPEYLGSFTIHPYTQITQDDSPLSQASGCPKSITIENENNEVITLHPDAPEPTSDKCEVLQRWVDALSASVDYSREMSRQRDLLSIRKSTAPMQTSAQFSLVIGHKQPHHDMTSAASAQMSAGMLHEYFSMALMETIGQLVSKIVDTFDLKWLDQPAILFRGRKPTAGGAPKVGFLGDKDDVALHPGRTMEQFMKWAGKADSYACFIAPEALDWEQMMPWEDTGADNRRLLVRDVPIELDSDDASKRKKSSLRRERMTGSHVRVTNTKLSVVVMLRRMTRFSWHLRLEILKVVGLDPNRTPKSEVCEVECWKHKINATGELSQERVAETSGKKATEVVKGMQVPEFTKANRPERFDFTVASPNITSLNITLKSGGRTLATKNLEPLDIMSFASPIFLNQMEKHVELPRQRVPYTMPLHTQLVAEPHTQSTAVLPDSFGEAITATNQVGTRIANARPP